jgi:hypothetical protein
MTYPEALRVVGHLLEHHPTTNASARDARGISVSVLDPDASRYCLTGALVLVAERFQIDVDSLFLSAARLVCGSKFLTSEASGLSFRWDRQGPGWRREAVEQLKRAGL